MYKYNRTCVLQQRGRVTCRTRSCFLFTTILRLKMGCRIHKHICHDSYHHTSSLLRMNEYNKQWDAKTKMQRPKHIIFNIFNSKHLTVSFSITETAHRSLDFSNYVWIITLCPPPAPGYHYRRGIYQCS